MIEATLADLETRFAAARAGCTQETLEPEEIELIVGEIERLVGRVDRLCSSIILRPGGLSPGVIDSLQLLKVITSHTRWHLKHPLPEANGQATT